MLASCWPPAKEVPINTGHVTSLFPQQNNSKVSYSNTTGCPLHQTKKKILFLYGWSLSQVLFKTCTTVQKKNLCAQDFPLVASALSMRFEVLTALLLRIYIFWDVVLCCRITTVFTRMQDDPQIKHI
jgi:hypothetical protein